MLLLFGGIMEWGWAMRTETATISAAREGARTGAGTDQDDDPETSAELRAAAMLDDAGLDSSTATITATQTGVDPDGVITVDVSLPHPALVPLIPSLTNLTANATMRMQDQP
jgi:hypothetical protein